MGSAPAYGHRAPHQAQQSPLPDGCTARARHSGQRGPRGRARWGRGCVNLAGTLGFVWLFAARCIRTTHSVKVRSDAPVRGAVVVDRRPTVAVVGNDPHRHDQSDAIDACDVVVRLNKAPGFGAWRGEKVDELVLINCGGQMEEWLNTGEIMRSPAFVAAGTITLPIHPQKARLIEPPLTPDELDAAEAQDFTRAAIERCEAEGKPVRTYTADFFAASMAALGHPVLTRDLPAPSTGYLVARWWTETGRHDVHAFGFGFEGWEGHDFAAERRWFDAMERAGRLTVHPFPSAHANAA